MSTPSAPDDRHACFDTLDCGILLLDRDLSPTWSNRFYREHVAERLRMCETHCFTGMNPGTERCEDCLPPQVLHTGRTRETLRSFRSATGAELSYRVVITPNAEGVAVFVIPLDAGDHAPGGAWRERFLLSAIRNSHDAIFALDRQNTVRFWNRGAERLFGWTIAETVGRGLDHLLVAEEEANAELFLTDGPVEEVPGREIRLRSRDRGVLWVEVSRTPLLDGSGRPNGASFVVRDVTERRAAMETMAFAERMSAVGNMAAALAHEIGTPLGVINASTEELLLDLDEQDPRREELALIMGETERIGGLVRNLLEFARPEAPVFDAMDLDPVLDRVGRLLRHTARKQSTTLRVESSGALFVHGDANQIEQVLLNLAMNGLQAVGGGGQVWLRSRREGDEAVLEVADDGPGIDPSVRERIFHPFITTKSNGTGLGLAVAKRIVQEHRGSLTSLERGTGAAFQVRLPVLEPKPD